MKASIVTIGDEILNGTTIDTNSAYIAKKAVDFGIEIMTTHTVSDSKEGIYHGLSLAKKEASIIFITGGLGPTKDDITKKTIADFLEQDLIFNAAIFKKIEDYFKKRGKKQVELNRKLAYFPERANQIPNDKGTAIGMWFEEDGVIYISMPGVPHEMKHMLDQYVLPKLQDQFQLPILYNEYLMCAGIGESAINEKIEDIENDLPDDISLAYLPTLGVVKLRLSSKGDQYDESKKEAILRFKEKINSRLNKHIYSDNPNQSLAEVIGQLLKEKKAKMATAESCTGGSIAKLITAIPGCSAYYEGSVVAYSYAIKRKLLAVKEETLQKYGAVSEECVKEMLNGLLDLCSSDYGIAVSGIAGPGGGTPTKPVGTVWVAVGNKHSQVCKKYELTKNRAYNIQISAVIALNLLRNFIEND